VPQPRATDPYSSQKLLLRDGPCRPIVPRLGRDPVWGVRLLQAWPSLSGRSQALATPNKTTRLAVLRTTVATLEEAGTSRHERGCAIADYVQLAEGVPDGDMRADRGIERMCAFAADCIETSRT
jgi:hypothetical protein